MPTYTTNFDLSKPLVGNAVDQDLWGGELNNNADIIDSQLLTAQNFVTRSVTTSEALSVADKKILILCDATSGSITLTNVSAATAGNGFTFAVKKTDSSANTVTITGTIDGDTNLVLNAEKESVILVSDGTNWQTIGFDYPIDASDTQKGIIEIATSAEVEAASSAVLAVTPLRMKDHYGVARGIVTFNQTGAVQAQMGDIASVSRTAAGAYTVTTATSYTTIFPIATLWTADRSNALTVIARMASSTTITVNAQEFSGGALDPDFITLVYYANE